MPRSGKIRRDSVVVVAVLALFAAIFFPIAKEEIARSRSAEDARRMRMIYVAAMVYGQDWNETAPLSLQQTRPYLSDDGALTSTGDPFADARATSYPLDPAEPSILGSPVRVSFSYLGSFLDDPKLHLTNWSKMNLNPHIGLIASFYYGDIRTLATPFSANVHGPILRLDMDGALVHPREKTQGSIDPRSLFLEP